MPPATIPPAEEDPTGLAAPLHGPSLRGAVLSAPIPKPSAERSSSDARKPMDLPRADAKAFVADMRAYHREPNAIKRDEIAACQA